MLQFYNLIIAILLMAAIASLFLGKNVEATAILIIVTLNATVATAQENSATNALEALAQMSSPLCTPTMTPLQHGLHKLGFLIGSIAMFVCALLCVVGLLRGVKDLKNPDRDSWLTVVMVAVSLAVSAVPEGLPMVVTICLSVGTAAMVKKNVLVRELAAVETLGAASGICTDKTGTLTEGKMTAIKMWGDFKLFDITGKGFNPEGGIFLNGVNQATPATRS
ncbi:hypothetical protein P43SY_010294 [Pythium insidiosum]|uniref:Uncharacterized protein n=1 Tax=Pythium insidiosum TaxID=114742 RepID=A0AAD5Q0I5_PYTIN|nr:hypothetical protein P43SY_010294 [Pythium insidiosum]